MQKQTLEELFNTLKEILKKESSGMNPTKDIDNSKAKIKKAGFHLYGKKEVSILGRKPRKVYFCGIIMQKNFVGFYFMPLYSHPNKFKLSQDLKKIKKGKSCLNIKDLSPNTKNEIIKLIRIGKSIYKKEGWV